MVITGHFHFNIAARVIEGLTQLPSLRKLFAFETAYICYSTQNYFLTLLRLIKVSITNLCY